jgi:hypothetical protein
MASTKTYGSASGFVEAARFWRAAFAFARLKLTPSNAGQYNFLTIKKHRRDNLDRRLLLSLSHRTLEIGSALGPFPRRRPHFDTPSGEVKQ